MPRVIKRLTNLVETLLDDVFVDALLVVIDGDRAPGQLLLRHL